MKLVEHVLAHTPEMVAIRRDIHAHPEVAFEEVRTSALVAAKLREWGYTVHTGIAQTGVVGVLKCGNSHKSIGLRAEMDALPMTELNQFGHASTQAGKMHGCGHDGHTAMLLSAAKCLAHNRNFDGTLYLVFQPAEENGGGAGVMVREGLFERFPMDAIFGVHNWPGLAVGQFAISSGAIMAASSEFKIVVHGKGGHAAVPHDTQDPILIGCQLVQAFQSIVSRNCDPQDSAVVSVTILKAGEASNVIPDSCTIEGTVRSFSVDVSKLIEQRMRDISTHLCAAFGATCDFEMLGSYPPTINHAKETDVVRILLQDAFGVSSVQPLIPTMGAEDFSFYLQHCPGAFFFVGNGEVGSVDGGGNGGAAANTPSDHRERGHAMGPCMLHNPSYDFNDALIPIGGSMWVRLVERCLPLV